MRIIILLSLLASFVIADSLGILLGGNADLTIHNKIIKVSSISPKEVYINEKTTFRILGENLAETINIDIDGCSNTQIIISSSWMLEFSCMPISEGRKVVSLEEQGNVAENLYININKERQNNFSFDNTLINLTAEKNSSFIFPSLAKYTGNTKETMHPNVEYYFSKNMILDNSDTLIGSINAYMDSNKRSCELQVDIFISNSVEVGDYYIISTINANNKYVEFDKSNNQKYQKVTVQDSKNKSKISLQLSYLTYKDQPLELIVNTSNIDNQNAITYTWKFGDGNTGSGKSVSHTYITAGTYPIEVQVEYDDVVKVLKSDVLVKESAVNTEIDISNWKEIKGGNYHDIVFENGRFMVVGKNGDITTSINGKEWQELKYNNKNKIKHLYAVTYGNGKWVAVGGSTQNKGVIVTSSDGLHWTVKNNLSKKLTDVYFANNLFVCVGDRGAYSSLDNGDTWSKGNVSGYVEFTSVIYDKKHNKWIAAANRGDSRIHTSVDGVNWIKNTSSLDTFSIFSADCYSGKTILTGYRKGEGGVILSSEDGGETWKSKIINKSPAILSVKYTALGWLASIGNGKILSSQNGENWSDEKINLSGGFESLAYGNSKLLAIRYNGVTGLNIYNAQIKNSKKLFHVALNVHNGGTVAYGGDSFSGKSYFPANEGDSVTVNAVPDDGYTFSYWSGDCTGNMECNLNISANKQIEAHFSQSKTLTVYEPSYGYVSSTDGYIKCGGNFTQCSHDYIENNSVQLVYKENVDAPYRFESWSGDVSSTSTTTTLLMNKNKNVSIENKVNAQPNIVMLNELNTTKNIASYLDFIASDDDGDIIENSMQSSPSQGTAVIMGNRIIYTPNTDFVGNDQFIIMFNDGHGATVNKTVSVVVNSENNLPILSTETNLSMEKNSELIITIDVDDSDELDTVIATISTEPLYGSLQYITSTSTYIQYKYIPNIDYTGSDTFTVKADDGNGGIAYLTIPLDINTLRYTLSVKRPLHGYIYSDIHHIRCGDSYNDCTYEYLEDTTVSLHYNSYDPRIKLDAYTGDCVEKVCSVTMNENKNVSSIVKVIPLINQSFIQPKVLTEGENYEVFLSAEGSDTLVWSINSDSAVTIDTHGRVVWNNVQEGTHTITATVTNSVASDSITWTLFINPVVDSDGDGISDSIELSLGLNPNLKDSDGDGYLDNEEIGPDVNHPRNTDGTDEIDALDNDSDNDGVSDKVEREMGTNHLNAEHKLPTLSIALEKSEVKLGLGLSAKLFNFTVHDIQNGELSVELINNDEGIVMGIPWWVASNYGDGDLFTMTLNTLKEGVSSVKIKVSDTLGNTVSKDIRVEVVSIPDFFDERSREKMTWEDANDYCAANSGRLPTIEELRNAYQLVDNYIYLQGIGKNIWSSSENSDILENFYQIYANESWAWSNGSKLEENYVHCVVDTSPKVVSVTPKMAILGEESIFTITGSNLPLTTKLWIAYCDNMQALGGSDTTRRFSCTPVENTGIQDAVIKDRSGGTLLKEFTIDVQNDIIYHTLTVEEASPSGYVYSDDGTIKCGRYYDQCSYDYPEGSTIALHYSANNTMSKLAAYTGDCAGKTCSVTMNTSKTVGTLLQTDPVIEPPIVSLNPLMEGDDYNITLSSDGSAPFNWSIESYPSVTIGIDTNGHVTWDNMQAGEYQITATASNLVGSNSITWILIVEESLLELTLLELNTVETEAVEQGKFDYYKISASSTDMIGIVLSNLSADLDLYVKKGVMPSIDDYDCRSYAGGTTDEKCLITIETGVDIFIAIHGFRGGNYDLEAKSVTEVQRPFITTWKTDNDGVTNDNQIKIGTKGIGYDYKVDWGDGTSDVGVYGDINHTYNSVGTYTVKIWGEFPQFYFGYDTSLYDNDKLLSVNQWGDINWKSMQQSFYYCTKLHINAADKPDLSRVQSMAEMFSSAWVFNEYIGDWDVSNVTDMHHMFENASEFNQDIGNWNVNNVTDMAWMFSGAYEFDQNISSWNTKSAHKMRGMFYSTLKFNIPLNNWDVSKVTDMAYMFNGSFEFNQPLDKWDTSNVTNMLEMFKSASRFNQDISSWNIEKVTNMDGMFSDVTLSTENYSNILKSWATLNLENNVSFSGGNSTYSINSDISRQNIIDNFAWTITDGGIETDTSAPEIPILITQVPTRTIENTITIQISGEIESYISINGVEKQDMGLNGKSDIVLFLNNGNNIFNITLTNMQGNKSEALTFSIIKEELVTNLLEYNFTKAGVVIPQSFVYYKVSALLGQYIRITLSELSNDIDMYVRQGEIPTLNDYDCSPYMGGLATEECLFSITNSEDVYIAVHGYIDGGNYNLKAILEIDSDDDGIVDSEDEDDDNDSIPDVLDAFPLNPDEWLDTDGDGIGNNTDTDDDGDGVLDYNDDLPLNPHESADTDHDGIGNNADRDDDNDGISDADERKWGFDPFDASDGGNADTDGDGVSNVDEIEAGSNPLDKDDTKKPKRFVPIIMDDLMVMVPYK